MTDTAPDVDDNDDDDNASEEPAGQVVPIDDSMVFRSALEQSEPITFWLQLQHEDGTDAELLQLQAKGDPGVGAEVVLRSMAGKVINGSRLVELMNRFLTGEARSRFAETLDRPDRVVHADVLASAVHALIERYTGRPTSPSSASAAGRRPTGKSSKGKRR